MITTCTMCGFYIHTDGCYIDPVLHALFDYRYCSWFCWQWHINSK